uniref:Uncharacterized protein n=2 Tax=Clytia hemisphaerica TaxID=252671 RepID=A0A7M5X7K0_9CNID
MDVDFASDKRPSALSSRRDVLKLGYSLDNKREGVTYSSEYSHWIEKKLYAKDKDTENLYTASGFRVTFKVYENHYLDHKNGRGFLIGYMSYKKVTDSEKKDDDDGLSPFIIFVIVACSIGVLGVCSWYCSRHSTRRNENASSNELNEEERRSLNRPSPNLQPRLIIHVRQGDQELHHIDQRNSITSVNQTNGNLPDAQLSEEAPPAYNPHSNYPTEPPRSNRPLQNNINEEAPPPSYEDVLQGTYG